MFREIIAVIFAGIITMSIPGVSFAMNCGSAKGSYSKMAQAEVAAHEHTNEAEATVSNAKEAVNVGNKICPVSGEKIEEKVKATYEYEGKIYNFCCAMCIDDFKKDPQKYIKKIEEEKQKEETKKE